MLLIQQPPSPVPANYTTICHESQILRVAAHMTGHNASFYMEPWPFSKWRVTVGHEHKHLLKQILEN